MFRTILLAAVTACFPFSICLAANELANTHSSNAVLLQYHHVSNSTPAITSVTPEQFEAHLQLIEALDMVVLPVGDIISDIQSGRPVPKNAVAITFDDGYESIYSEAFPRLKKRNWPFTVFINPLAIEDGHGSQMTWQQLNDMQKHGATIANHSHYHNHLLQRLEHETETAWLTRTLDDIRLAQSWLNEKLKVKKTWVAYPYGEMNETLKTALLLEGYLGFSQQSGPINHTTDWQAIPRFPASGIYANVNTLKTKLASLAFEVIQTSPSHELRMAGEPFPIFRLVVKDRDIARHTIQCFHNGASIETNVERKKDQKNGSLLTITTMPEGDLPLGRSRVNCTAKSTSSNRYYWHSMPFIATNKNREFVD